MNERRIWAGGILAILLLALLCTWRHYAPPVIVAPSATPSAPVAATPAVVPSAVVLPDPSLRGQWLDDKFTVTGMVPDQASKDALLARAASVYGKDNVIDRMQVASTASPGWFKSLLARFPPDLRGLTGASLATAAGALVLEGEAASDAERSQRAERVAAALGPDIRIENRLTVKAPSAAQSATAPAAPAAGSSSAAAAGSQAPGRATAALTHGTVRFVTSSAALTPKARASLRALAKSIKAGDANARYQVTGFTDSRGSDAVNLKLSERRAKAVQVYLTKLGVGSDRLETAAKGSAEPVADNQTVAGRKENRRAEVRLL